MLRHLSVWVLWSIVATSVIGFKLLMGAEPFYALCFGFSGMIFFFVAIAATWGSLRRSKQAKIANNTTQHVVVSQVELTTRPYVLMSYKGKPYDFVHNDPTASSVAS